MSGYEVRIAGLEGLVRFLRGVVRVAQRFAVVTLLGVAAIVALLADDGFGVVDAIVTILVLAPPAVLLFFAAGLRGLLVLPERLRRMPHEGAAELRELTQIASEARRTGFRRAPFLLWRLRGAIGSTRDLVGFAVPLRVLTPAFLGLTLLAAFLCVVVLGAGVVALIVLAAA